MNLKTQKHINVVTSECVIATCCDPYWITIKCQSHKSSNQNGLLSLNVLNSWNHIQLIIMTHLYSILQWNLNFKSFSALQFFADRLSKINGNELLTKNATEQWEALKQLGLTIRLKTNLKDELGGLKIWHRKSFIKDHIFMRQ